MQLQTLCDWVQNTAVGAAMRQSDNLFPAMESLHVLCLAVMMGTIALVDLRLMGLVNRDWPVSRTLRAVLPFTITSFIVVVCTGTLMWMAHAEDYMENGPFLAKMALMGAAGINILIFHGITQRSMSRWDDGRVPARAIVAGATSLLLWIAIVACGRWIGFTAAE